MKKILIIFTLLLGFSFSIYGAENRTQHGKWWVYNYIDNFNDKKIIAIYQAYTNDVGNIQSIQILTSSDFINIGIAYIGKNKNNIKIFQYRFDNEKIKSINVNMNSDVFNLFIINKQTNNKEALLFIKKIVNSKRLRTTFDNNTINIYDFELVGIKEILKNTDFSNTLLDKYKNEILN